MIYRQFISCLFLGLFILSDLSSVSIDLSKSDFTFTLPQDECLELIHFQKHTVYVLQIEGLDALRLSDTMNSHSIPVTITEHHAVLIENEEQLSEEDLLLLIASPTDQKVKITKREFRSDEHPNLGNEKWGKFIDKARDWSIPGDAVFQLVEWIKENHCNSNKMLSEGGQDVASDCSNLPRVKNRLSHVLTVGCESGKDSLYWANHGSDVTILDGTPHAVAVTMLRFANKNLLHRLKGAYAAMIEEIPDTLSSFDAITGTAVFPFISPHKFEDVMVNKLFPKIIPSGYFAGHFFGPEHAWSSREDMTFVSVEDLMDLFTKNGFEILWVNEIKKIQQTIFQGNIQWHEIQLIAKKGKG